MKYIELENDLKMRVRKRRIVEGVLTFVFLITSIIFTVLYDNSKTVEIIGYPPFAYESVTYNRNYLWGIMVGYIGLICSGIFLISDIIFSKLETVEVGEDVITFYRGLLHTNIYVNGEYKDGISFIGYYLEAPLSDGTMVTVSIGKQSVHLTFSNGHPPIDL